MMPDPLDFIAQFALLFAGYILMLSAILYVRKKMYEEGKDWVGIQIILGIFTVGIIITLFYFGIFLFFFAFYFIMPLFIGIPLILAYRVDSKRVKRKRIKYEAPGMKTDLRLVAGTLGPFLILIGAVILVIFMSLYLIMGGFDPEWTLSFLITFLWGIIAIIGIILEVFGKKFGRFFCLLAGILAVVGQYIPIGRYTYGYGYYYTIYLSVSLMQFEPYLILIGALISVASKDEYFKYFSIKREFRKKYFDIKTEMDNIPDLETFLREKLSADWEKIHISFKAYKAGELEKDTFIETAIKNIGNKFIEIFREQKRGKLDES
ncbi:MAG: hypothetical protein ACXAEX_00745 [Promethearchaeota archaeon]|jgi:hypothetical protein